MQLSSGFFDDSSPRRVPSRQGQSKPAHALLLASVPGRISPTAPGRLSATLLAALLAAILATLLARQAQAQSTSGEWRWMSGISALTQFDSSSSNYYAPGSYGALGTYAEGNSPGGRYGSVNWTDTGGNLWLFGGEGYDSTGTLGYLNDLWEHDPGKGQWRWLGGSSKLPSCPTVALCGQPGDYGNRGEYGAGNAPGARSGSTSWVDADGNFWLFGGTGCDSTPVSSRGCGGSLNDLWEYNPSEGKWRWMSGSTTLGSNGGKPGDYGKRGVYAAGNAPGGRSVSASWIDRSGNLWLLGGLGLDSVGDYGSMNDLWEFMPEKSQWRWMSGSSKTGELGQYGVLGVYGAGNVPGERQSSMSWTDASGNLWLFGGYGMGWEYFLNDLWEYSPSWGEWRWMSGSSKLETAPDGYSYGPAVYGTQSAYAPRNVPGARRAAASWTDAGGNFWLAGGWGFDSVARGAYLNDLWEYNPVKGQWRWMSGSSTVASCTGTARVRVCGEPGSYGTEGAYEAGNVPGGRESSASWTDADSNLWLMGGDGYDSNHVVGFMNDLWQYDTPCGAPVAVFSTTALKLAAAVDDTSAPVTLAVSNSGCHLLKSITATISGSGFAQSSGCEGVALMGEQSCAITVTYTPKTAVTLNGSLTIATNAGSQTVKLTGTTAGLAARVGPASLAFGSQAAGETSAAKNAKLTNTGTAEIAINSVSISPVNSVFAQGKDGTCTKVLLPGASCTIPVVFTPKTASSYTSSLEILTSAAAVPMVLNLSGHGAAATTLSVTSLSFGSLPAGKSAAKTVTLTNNQNIALTGLGAATPNGFSVTGCGMKSEAAGMLAAHGSCTLTVTFAPDKSATYSGNIKLTATGMAAGSIAVTGKGN